MTTFVEKYYEAVHTPTPRQAFIKEIAEATGASLLSVQNWCAGKYRPYQKARESIARHLGIPADELFPKKK